MNSTDFDRFCDDFLDQCKATLRKARKEYAREVADVFANFSRVGDWLGESKERVLMVYLLKHLDGILAHIDGHKAQREGVEGRIMDAINYLLLLGGMLREEVSSMEVSDGGGDASGVLSSSLEESAAEPKEPSWGPLVRPPRSEEDLRGMRAHGVSS
ncbi:MAG: hypothetical protein D6812_04480 [Deltaproteobacteria bacterium]|nr:MAG: hypothetical protein D6812_04480 [Deltaproteobacteria bacterium]